MIQSVLLVAVTAILTWFIARWVRSTPDRPKRLSSQESEAERAKEIGTQLDGVVPLIALLVFLGFALWGCLARGQSETNSFGPPVAA